MSVNCLSEHICHILGRLQIFVLLFLSYSCRALSEFANLVAVAVARIGKTVLQSEARTAAIFLAPAVATSVFHIALSKQKGPLAIEGSHAITR